MSKVQEKIVFNNIYPYLIRNGLLSERNSGFKKLDGTVNQLIHIVNNIYNGLDDGKDICLVFMDISKAFDRVYHPGLLFKLRQLGNEGRLLDWFKSYLENRRQRVVINGVTSEWKFINAGVPQGSILGPILFLVYINDLVENLETMPYLFADDTSLLELIDKKHLIESFTKINRDLTRMSQWAHQWRVNFNPTKTVYMIISNKVNRPIYPNLLLGNTVLTRVSEHSHLGIILNDKMTWDNHIDMITKKAAFRIDALRRIRHLVSRETKETLYKSIVRPVLEYASVIFDNTTTNLKQRLERLQYRAGVICTGALKRTPNRLLMDELGWDSLDSRRKASRLVIYYKMVKGLVPDYLRSLLPNIVGPR